MKNLIKRWLPAVAIAALAIGHNGAAHARMFEDGRIGPLVVNDEVLNGALKAMNGFLQARYQQDDMMAALHEPAQGDFAEIAAMIADAPAHQLEAVAQAFGLPIAGGRDLDRHLAAFNTDVLMRGEDLFTRLARAESAKASEFNQVAASLEGFNVLQDAVSSEQQLSDFGPRVNNDATLNAQMRDLAVILNEFDSRDQIIAHAVPAITGETFDRYMMALAITY